MKEDGYWGAQAPRSPKSLSLNAGQLNLDSASHQTSTWPTNWLVSFKCKYFLFSAQHFVWQTRCSSRLPQHSPEQLSLLATQASVSPAKCRRMFAFSGEGFLSSLGVPRDLIGILNVKSHSRKEGRVRSNMKDKCSGLPLPVYSI